MTLIAVTEDRCTVEHRYRNRTDGRAVASTHSVLPESEYYVDLEAALDALRRRSLFNVIDVATGWKIDLIIQKARAFSIEELRRRVAVDLYGIELFVASAEDVVISKLEAPPLRAGCCPRSVEISPVDIEKSPGGYRGSADAGPARSGIA